MLVVNPKRLQDPIGSHFDQQHRQEGHVSCDVAWLVDGTMADRDDSDCVEAAHKLEWVIRTNTTIVEPFFR